MDAESQLKHAITLNNAAKSEAGQLYHRHVRQLIDEKIDALLEMGIGCTNDEVVAVVRQLQGMVKCLESEGDAIHKGLQQGMRLSAKHKVAM